MKLPSKEKCFEWTESIADQKYVSPFTYNRDMVTLHDYELQTLIHRAYREGAEAMREEAIEVVQTYRVSVGNSAAGERAAEWTIENLREVRDEIRNLKVEE